MADQIKALVLGVRNGLLGTGFVVAIVSWRPDRKLMRNHPAPLVATVMVAVLQPARCIGCKRRHVLL